MLSSSLWSAFAAVYLTAAVAAQDTTVEPIPTPTVTPKLSKMEYQGCFSSSEPLVDYGPWDFQSTGNCQPICGGLGKSIMALVDGTNCYCGDLVPREDSKVEDDKCSTPCQGFDQETCGGNGFWKVWTSGLNKNKPEFYVPDAASSSSPAATSAPQETVIQTVPAGAPSSSDTNKPSGGGANTPAIAAGVVVGVVVMAALIGGFIIFMRRRRRAQAEESYKRHNSVNDFVGKPPGTGHSSLTDTRLDPEIMMRRQSDGSIADNQDYSRRILQVRNF